MASRVVFSRRAERRLTELYDYIAEASSPVVAIGYIRRIRLACLALGSKKELRLKTQIGPVAVGLLWLGNFGGFVVVRFFPALTRHQSPLVFASAIADDKAAPSETHLLADLQHFIPPGLAAGRCDDLLQMSRSLNERWSMPPGTLSPEFWQYERTIAEMSGRRSSAISRHT